MRSYFKLSQEIVVLRLKAFFTEKIQLSCTQRTEFLTVLCYLLSRPDVLTAVVFKKIITQLPLNFGLCEKIQ